MQKKPPQFHGSGGKTVDLDCFSRRHETWCGMSREEVDTFLKERRIDREREAFLFHWTPPSSPN